MDYQEVFHVFSRIPKGSDLLGNQQPITTLDRDERGVLNHQWKSVSNQAQQALDFMRKHPIDFPHAASVGLLVIRVARTLGKKMDPAEELVKHTEKIASLVEEMRTTLRPSFLAIYRPPLEMRISKGWGDDASGVKLFPAVIFAATVCVKASAGNKKTK